MWAARAALVLLLLTIGMLPLSPAIAQQSGARVEEELRRTDAKIELAESIIRESQSERARQLLEQAKSIQSSAWENFRQGRLLIAGKLTIEARLIAQRAMGLAREDLSIKNRAQRELEIAQSLLQDAKERITESREERALHLLDEARAQIDRGNTQIGEQHYEAALRLALSARRLIRQALRLADDAGGAGRAEIELERTESILERARAYAADAGDEQALLLLERATQIQERAHEAYRSSHFRAVFPGTREARSLAQRAMARIRGPVGKERVNVEIARTQEALARAAETVEGSANSSAQRLLENAKKHQERARRLLEKEKYRPAFAQAIVARRLATRAETMVKDEIH
jgi:hypothetical protein